MREKGSAHILILILLLAGLVAGVYLVTSGNPLKLFSKASETQTQSKIINNLTQELLLQKDKYEKAGKTGILAEREQALNSLVSIAVRRKEELLKEIESNPQVFLNDAKLADQKQSFPKEVQAFLEENIKAKGKFLVTHFDDFSNKTSKTLYYLKEDSKRYSLFFSAQTPDLLSDSVIEVKGIGLDQKMAILNEPSSFRVISEASIPSNRDIRVAIILYKFQGVSEPFTPSEVETVAFGSSSSIKSYYQENSLNQTAISGNVLGWYTIPYLSPSSCGDIFLWENAAKNEAQKAGVDLATYTNIYFVSTYVGSCYFGGFADLGGSIARANGRKDLHVFVHELGHNLGVHHANEVECGSKAIDFYANCRQFEYGDIYDAMGIGTHHFNAPHKIALGWIPQSQIQTVNADGEYTISNIEQADFSIKVLKIARKDLNEDYYVEFRKSTGFDLPSSGEILDGTAVHLWDGFVDHQTNLIDTTPASSLSVFDSLLTDGQSFTDQLNGIAIKQKSHTDSSATIEVKFSPVTDPADSLLGNWRSQSLLPKPVYKHGLAFSSNAIFKIGGEGENRYSFTNIYSAPVGENGTIGSWSQVAPLPDSISFNWDYSVAQYQNFVYAVGGYGYLGVSGRSVSSQGGGDPGGRWGALSQVLFTRINSGSSIGSWAATTALPKGLTSPAVIAANDYLFVAGGVDGNLGQSSVYVAPISTNGTLGSWVTTTSLPKNLNYHSLATDNNYLFVSGGNVASGGYLYSDYQDAVYRAKINNDGSLGNWTMTTPLPRKLSNHASLVYNGDLIILGGRNEDNQSQYSIYFAKIDSAGNLGSWNNVSGAPLPKSLFSHGAITANGYLFVVGGVNNWVYQGQQRLQSAVYSAPLQNLSSPPATPSPIPTPTPTSTPTPTPISSPTPQPTPSPSPTPLPGQRISLSAGNNLIGLAVDKGWPYKAENLLRDLNYSGGSVNEIKRLDPATGQYITHILGSSDNNFDIRLDQGYFVRSSNYFTINISGASISQSPEIAIPAGQSLISFPVKPTNVNTAEELLQAFKKQGINVTSISRWINGAWNTHIFNFPANNFDIKIGEGYSIKNTGGAAAFQISTASSQSTQVLKPSPASFSCTACAADVNKDKKVNISDYSLWAFCRARGIKSSPRCSSIEDNLDFKCLTSQFGKKC
ncbi:hypothetical protein HYT74_02425 [Candidatus Daviesbacteria bacterium]|nr:hypothetical protein [Candidatus Daviesbacteria bacterium]